MIIILACSMVMVSRWLVVVLVEISFLDFVVYNFLREEVER